MAALKKQVKEEEKKEAKVMEVSEELKMIDSIMQTSEKQDKKVEEEFESRFAQRSNKGILYGKISQKNLPETSSLLKGVNLDDLFPK